MAERKGERAGDHTDKCMAAMKEDLAAWMSRILNLMVTAETLLEDLETGVVLCRLANTIQSTGEEFLEYNSFIPRDTFPPCGVTYKERTGFRGSFLARDNVANFIRWCRQLGVADIIMFETEDLVLHKNEKSVILTLMDVARLSVKFGLEPPDLVRLENEIDQEIEEQPDEIMEEPMVRLKKKHKSHSLDDLVYQVLEQCTCPVKFPVLRVAEGKYRMGENKSLIFVRVMRKHVMVRVGGGWDTLERYFEKHDPCKMSERQRRNSVRSPRSRSGSDVIGRSLSSMSISSTDSHDSCGIPVAHGRTASWSSPQSSQLKSPRDPVRRRMTSVSPSRSSSPSSPRLQQRQRRGTLTRDTPPRTIDTQARGRLSRKSKSMQELSSVVVDGRRPSYSNPTTSSMRKQSVTGENSQREGTSTSNGNPGQARRKSSVTSPRKLSGNLGPQGDSPAGRNRLSLSGPVGSPRSGPVQVTRSASFGARPRPMTPVMEPRAKSTMSSRPTRDMQRRASSAMAGRVDSSEDARRGGPIAKRRSSSATPDGKSRVPGSRKPAQNSTEVKQERSRKPSVSKMPSPQPKTTQPVAKRKISTESARGRRSLPSTPRERKSSTSQQNEQPKHPAKAIAVESKAGGCKTPPSSRRDNKLVNQNKEPGSKMMNGKNTASEKRTKKGSQTNHGEESINDSEKSTHGMVSLPLALEDNPEVTLNVQSVDQSIDSSDQLDVVGDDYNEDVFSPNETYSQTFALNGGAKTSECSLETDSDFTSDRLSDFTDTDNDFRNQRYSGLSETSSDFSFGTSPAWKLFHSVENGRNNPLESSGEPDVLELGTSPTVKDCLVNLNLQGSVTPTMKRRIFEAAHQIDPKEESPDLSKETVSDPANKAMFFDVEKYNDRSPDEEEVIVGSPRKLSLVQSLINSIERRSGSSSHAHTTPYKNAAVGTRPTSGATSKHSIDESAVTRRALVSNHETPCARDPKENPTTESVENGTEQRFCTSEEGTVSREHHIGYDVNKNLVNSVPSLRESPKLQQISGEKLPEGCENKTRKMSREKTRRKEKELDIFPRPQRQFTLEEMIQDMLPTNGESKETGDQRTLSPEPRFQAWL